MPDKKVNLSSSCTLEFYQWSADHKDVCLEYTEHSSDYWHSDSHTSIDIDINLAQEIVKLLLTAFPELKDIKCNVN